MTSLLMRYEQRVQSGQIDADAAQRDVAEALSTLATELQTWRAPVAPKSSIFGRARRLEPGQSIPRGLYIHGSVGRGKTMLMDLFFETTAFEPKKRWHFHAFMAAAHERIQRGRATTDGDPIPFVAAEIAAEAPLLCFDEFQVTDIADAMILGRLFKNLFEKGVVMVATSNAAPDQLYRDGLNRQLFLPFIALIEDRMQVVELDAEKDYRTAKRSTLQNYFSPLDDAASRALDARWEQLTAGHAAKPLHLDVLGRKVRVPLAANGVARFSFADLCEKPLGSRDYLAIAKSFHTVLIDGIPTLAREKRNEARRFITLIDVLYDQQIGLVASAAAEPDALYMAGDGSEAFQRTASRLVEMRGWAKKTGHNG
jgi:cell division protein ZapE